jgi:lysophospholipase L1-like esterase
MLRRRAKAGPSSLGRCRCCGDDGRMTKSTSPLAGSFRKKCLPRVLLLILTAVPRFASAVEKPDEFLAGVHRILFLGDSITYSAQYVDEFQTQLLLRLPQRHFEVINCGLPSETVSGLSEAGHAGGKFPRPDLHERLDRVLAKVRPDLVFACYGMNDGIYLPLSDDRFARFKAGMLKLHDKVTASGARIVHLTPPVFDPVPIKSKVVPADKVNAEHPYEGYNDVLDAYSDWLLEQRAKAGWEVIDLHGPMKQAIAEKRKADPAFTFARDGIHPDVAGHRVMAAALLRGLKWPLDPEATDFGDPADANSTYARVRKLVHDRDQVLTDAWLTETGHQRPMPVGLPMVKAREQAAQIDRKIEEVRAAGK